MSPRIPYVPDDIAGDVADAIRRRRGGQLLDLDRMLLHNQAVADGWNNLLGAVRTKTSLIDAEREIAICWVAVLNDAQYEWDQHAPIAIQAGIAPDTMQQIKHGDVSQLSERLRLITQVTSAMTKRIKIDEQLAERALKELGEAAFHDLVVTVAAYNMVSRYLVGLKVGQ